jgi:predicted chitinase
MELTEELIRQISSRAKQDIIDGILDHAVLLEEFNIHEGLRRQHFLAQLAHE